MFKLFKIVQRFSLPSVFIFVLFLLGVLLVFKNKKSKLSRALLISSLFLYYLFSITPVADMILTSLENNFSQISQFDFDSPVNIVLLLGAGETDILRASEVLRIYFHKFSISNSQFSNERLRIIISGTSGINPLDNPAEKMRTYLIERGVSQEDIILEDKSRTTFESAKNLKDILKNSPFLLVTSAYHMKRSLEVFENQGMEPIPAPADFKTQSKYNLFDFFPSAENLKKADLAFHEYFGIIYYRLYYY